MEGGDSTHALQDSARGILVWRVRLPHGPFLFPTRHGIQLQSDSEDSSRPAVLTSLSDCRVLTCLQNALEKGLLPDDITLHQLVQDRNSVVYGQAVEGLAWPEEPLRATLISAHLLSPSLWNIVCSFS